MRKKTDIISARKAPYAKLFMSYTLKMEPMKCYVHMGKDAVGICSVCGQGVCENCAVKIGGKLYCRECADKEFAGKKEAVEKPMGINLLAILFGLGGAFSLLEGMIAIGSVRRLIMLGYTDEMAFTEAYLWGAIPMILGVMLLVASYSLWNLKRWGGFLGAILVFVALILDLRVFLSPLSIRNPGYFVGDFISSIIGIVINLAILVYLKKIWGLLY